MPGPPPPPPPNAPPPLSAFAPPKGNADDRGALLKSIQKGAKLKKTVTNDKSAPLISAKVSNNNSNSSASSPAASAVPNGMGLGGLFAGGMPKLRPTGKLGTPPSLSSSNNNLERRMPTSEPTKNFSSIQNELKKQLASDNKQRGPPPPAPIRNISDENVRVKPSNGLNLGVPQGNVSTLHRKTKSNANLSAFDTIDNVNNGFNNRPVINHGKPNLAPKPPVLNGKPAAPPKKLILNGKPVSRAHSMKSPRSPSPQSPAENTPMKFGTVRNMSSIISQSLTGSAGNLSPRPRNGRPSAPPPSIPPQPLLSQSPLPPSKLALVKPPNHAPPPPPSFLPQPPSHPPPLPPHRTQPSRAPPAVPGGGLSAPAPPPRNSSMREVSNTPKKIGIDLEEKFKHLFQSPDKFPRPPPYRNVLKLYSNKQVVNKQQAPQPPQFHVATRPWDPTAC